MTTAQERASAPVEVVTETSSGTEPHSSARARRTRCLHTQVVIRALAFDLDGVLLDSEAVWDGARRLVASEYGGSWRPGATEAMQGMSAGEWSEYMRAELAADLDSDRVVELVVGEVLDSYRRQLPVVEGAGRVLEEVGAKWPLALASSSNREVIDAVLQAADWAGRFRVTVSADEVKRGKPAPDVYSRVARLLGQQPGSCVAVEDSANGLRSALAAGFSVVAVPNRRYPPPSDIVGRADLVVDRLSELTVTRLGDLEAKLEARREHRLDEQELESFPASDPHSDWAGPPA